MKLAPWKARLVATSAALAAALLKPKSPQAATQAGTATPSAASPDRGPDHDRLWLRGGPLCIDQQRLGLRHDLLRLGEDRLDGAGVSIIRNYVPDNQEL
ncbi:MAG: hypothetical protein OXE02_03405 [Chloroflexi bacterium]|nr:hypothetical protein [Chloroflexota bacterium]